MTFKKLHGTCVVVLSGGQDSVTCLGMALATYEKVHAIAFNYNQKHTVELLCAKRICDQYEMTFEIMEIPMLSNLADSALVRGGKGDVNDKHHANPNLPASFVPNRNALFLTTAHAYAQKVGATDVITGVCETDYSGYPDCRRVFIDALEKALNVGYQTDIRIVTPLMECDKADVFALAEEFNFLDTVLNDSHTCYNGKRDGEYWHEWGHGCGECPACELRAKGWKEFLERA